MDSQKCCPYCAEEILVAAIKCKHCQSDLAIPQRRALALPLHPESIAFRAPSIAMPQLAMAGSQPSIQVDFDARRAATQVESAAINSRMSALLGLEILGTAFAFGCYKQSLAAGLLMLVGLSCSFFRAKTKYFLAFVFSVGWGFAAGFLVNAIDPTEPVAWFVAALLAAVSSLVMHMAAFQWQKDME